MIRCGGAHRRFPADLRGQITLAQAQVGQLQAQIAEFQVVPEYERVKEEADGIARRIKQLAQDDVNHRPEQSWRN